MKVIDAVQARKWHKGFTLLEMMTTISVMSVLALVASPSMGPFIAKQRMKAVAQDMADSIQMARSEALANGSRYQLTPVNSRDWSAGWHLEQVNTSGTNTALKHYGSAPDRIVIRTPSSSTVLPSLVFDQNARANTQASFEIGHSEFTLAPYCVAVAASGTLHITAGGCDAQ